MDSKACPIPEPFRARAGIVTFLAGLFFLNFLGRFILAPLMPAIERDLGLSHTQAGSLFLTMSLGFSAAQFGSGFFTSKFNHRKTLIISALGVGAVLFPLSFVHSIWMVQLSMVLLGLAAGLHLPSAIATITAMVSRNDWGKALGLHSTAPTFSLMAAPILVALLEGTASWRAIVLSVGVMAFLCGLAFVRYGRCGDFPGQAPGPAVIATIARQRSFWIMTVLFALGIGGGVGLYAMLPLFLIKECGMDAGVANTWLGVSQILGLLSTFFAGWVMDRAGVRKTIAVVLFSGGLATLFLGMFGKDWPVTILSFQRLIVAAYFPAGFAALSRTVPPHLRSVATSLITPSAFLIGGGALPTLIGYLGETRTFAFGITLFGALMLIAPILVVFLKLLEHDEEGC